MSFPVKFLDDIPGIEQYRESIKFLPSDITERIECYRADDERRANRKRGDEHSALSVLAGLGQSRICDFFIPLADCLLIVEETDLVASIEHRLKSEKDNSVDIFVEEFLDKAQGGADVLNRLYSKFIAEQGGESEPPQAKCEFWVVIYEISMYHKGDPRAHDIKIGRIGKIMNQKIPPPYVFAKIVIESQFIQELTNRLNL